MIPAKLMKDLEKKGFSLDFPSYTSNEDLICDILKEQNERLYLAIPLLIQEKFNYKEIISKLKKRGIFNKIIIITSKIFSMEHIDNKFLQKIIKEYKLKIKYSKNEFNYYYDSFKESIKREKEEHEDDFKEQLKIRGTLNTNLSLSQIYSPAKMEIMEKIYKHEPLSNTELKYYYKSIRPLNRSILNDNLRKYILLIESTRKLRDN